MPYGIPWDMPRKITGYYCFRCQSQHSIEYAPYCRYCGAKQPEEKRAQAIGLAIFNPNFVARYTHDLSEMMRFLDDHRGRPIRLWSYFVSHGELELRMRHSGNPGTFHQHEGDKEPWLNTSIYCSVTEFVCAPTRAWASHLRITETKREDDCLYELVDETVGLRIESRTLMLLFDLDPLF